MSYFNWDEIIFKVVSPLLAIPLLESLALFIVGEWLYSYFQIKMKVSVVH